MSENPVAEQESLKTRNWVLGSLVGILFLIIQSFFTYSMNNAVSKADKWGDKLEKLVTAQEVQQIKNELYDSRLTKLEAQRDDALKVHSDFEGRLRALEGREKLPTTYPPARQ